MADSEAGQSLFAGADEIRTLCRALAWSNTPLGAVERWPVSLRTAVRICLDAVVPMALWAGPDLTLLYNAHFRAMLGHDRHPWALGRPGREVLPEAWGQLGPDLERVMRSRQTVRHDNEPLPLGPWAGGAEPLVSYGLMVIPDDDDNAIAVLGVFNDWTGSSRALRQREERLATICAAVNDVLFLLRVEDGGGYRFESVNQAFSRTTGLTAEAVIGRKVEEVIPEPSLSLVRERYLEAITTRRPVKWQETTNYPMGQLVGDVAVTPLVDADGRVRRLVGAVHDMTDRKRAEEALRNANEQLRDVDRRKNEFLGMLSHELRNPLGPIMNSLYILEHAAPGGDQARRAQAVLRRQAEQLARLVDDLLDITRIKQSKIQLQRQQLEVNELVQRTIEDHRQEFEKAGVSLTFEPARATMFVSADWNRLAQVIGNLLQNAAKFTARGGHVNVSLAVDRARAQAVLRVADTGVGLDPRVADRLFEPFVQADATLDRSKGGLGLGLALVKQLVELHGGEVHASSAGPGTGSTFTVRLPLDERIFAAGEPARAVQVAQRLQVLVIEDNTDAADTLREVLELHGHSVDIAHNGLEGLATARVHHPDLVFCDIGLPGMDGYGVARSFREDEALRDVHLVALSGYARPDDLQRARAAGFEAHLAKPPHPEQLEAMLDRFASVVYTAPLVHY